MMKIIKKAGKKMVNQTVKNSVSPAQYLALQTAVSTAKSTKKRRARRGNAQSGHVPIPTNLATFATSSSRKETRETYRFTYVTGLASAMGRKRQYLVPFENGSGNNVLTSWDPKLALDALKYREFRVNKAKLIYNGGLASTVNGTIFFGSSRDPNIIVPTSEYYSYIEKNGKCGVTAPFEFALVHDKEFHTLSPETDIGGASDADRKVLCAGVFDLEPVINAQTATEFSGFRIDLELDITYRGLNPLFTGGDASINAIRTADKKDLPLNTNNINFPDDLPIRVRDENTVRVRVNLKSGFNLVRQFRHYSALLGTYSRVRDSAGNDVTNSRLVHRLTLFNENAGANYLNIDRGDLAGTITNIVSGGTVRDQILYGQQIYFARPGDYFETDKVSATTTTDIDIFCLSVKRIPQQRAIPLIKYFDPGFDESSIPVV